MALKKCRECGSKVSTRAVACPSCGAPIKRKSTTFSSGCGCLLMLVFAVLCIVIFSNLPDSPRPLTPSTNNRVSAQSSAPTVPDDVTYNIIDQETIPGIKRSLSIRLNKKVTKDVLTAIANELKRSDSTTYERTFIGYYLPGMEINAGYWASTHFNPDLDVRILGLAVDEETALRQITVDPSRNTVGNWLEERRGAAYRISIFSEADQLHMEQTFPDGSQGKYKLIEKSSPLGRRFEKMGRSFPGEHWILDSTGDLQLHGIEGHFSTASRLDGDVIAEKESSRSRSPSAVAPSAAGIRSQILKTLRNSGPGAQIYVLLKPAKPVLPTEDELKGIAQEERMVKEAGTGNDYDIHFYLPEMDRRGNPWATASKRRQSPLAVRIYSTRVPVEFQSQKAETDE